MEDSEWWQPLTNTADVEEVEGEEDEDALLFEVSKKCEKSIDEDLGMVGNCR